MNKSNLNRRELMRLLSLTMAGAALLPASSFAGATDKGRTVFIPPGEGKKGKMGVNDIVFKLNRSQTDGNLGSAEIVLQPGLLGSIPHYHNSFDEVCIVLEGSVTIKIENEIYNVAAGGWHLRPRGSVHCFWNAGTIAVRFIELYIPAGHEIFMQNLADLFIDNKIPSQQQVADLGEKYDTHFKWDQLPEVMKQYNVHL